MLLSLFVGVVIRESDLPNFYELFSNTVLYGSTFFLGLLLGVLCEANTILNPVVLKLLVLGILALLISGIGGILGGYVLYYWSGKKYNPVIGIAGVSCVPTHRQGRAEISGTGRHHPASRAGRQHQWRDHQRHFRGDLDRLPAANDAERLILLDPAGGNGCGPPIPPRSGKSFAPAASLARSSVSVLSASVFQPTLNDVSRE